MEEKEVKKTTKKDKINEKEIQKLKEELKEELKKEMFEELQENKKEERTEENKKSFEETAKETINKIMDTEDTTKEYEKKDIEENKGLAVLSYLGPLVLIPYLVDKKSKFVNYHKKQGLNLFVLEAIFGFIAYILTSTIQVSKMCTILNDVKFECGQIVPWWINIPIDLVELIFAVLSIVGLIYACQGKAKELPILGKIKIIK